VAPPATGEAETPPAGSPAGPGRMADPLITEARQFVAQMDAELRKLYVDASVTAWANETDITRWMRRWHR
jgi:hypothetical protein